MLKVNKVTYHDKKRNMLYLTIHGTYNNLRIMGIIASNLKTYEHKINWLNIQHGITLKEDEKIKQSGYKSNQSILNELTETEKENIIKAVKESEVYKKY